MAQSEKSNCMADIDKVWLDLTNFYSKIDMLSVVTPPTDITKQNTAAYLAGYLLRNRLPRVNNLYEFYPTEIVIKFVGDLEVCL